MLPVYTILLAPNPSLMTGPGTNTIIIGGGIEGASVIDPGCADLKHLEAIIQAGEERGEIRRILITHGHPDHLGGAVELRRMLGVSIYGYSQEGISEIDEALPDNFTLPAGHESMRAIYTPGHRFDHLCFYLEESQVLFAGDLIAGVGTNVISPPEGDMFDYIGSLKRLQQMAIREIVPAHGPIIYDAPGKLNEYIQHRMQREQQVIDVLNETPGIAIQEMVARIYADVNADLHPVAARSVEAHLLKLEREGRARRLEDARWRLIEA